jgi:hypothetical protein
MGQPGVSGCTQALNWAPIPLTLTLWVSVQSALVKGELQAGASKPQRTHSSTCDNRSAAVSAAWGQYQPRPSTVGGIHRTQTYGHRDYRLDA